MRINRQILLATIPMFALLTVSESVTKDTADISEYLPKAPEARRITAHRIEEKINIDGKLNESAWQKAPVTSDFFAWEEGGTRTAYSQTEVSVLWDDDYLYIGAIIHDQDIYAVHEKNNSNTWEDDVFEIFIKPIANMPHYYEFHVTPKNTTLQIAWPGRREVSIQDAIFEAELRSAVVLKGKINDSGIKDEGWIVEIAIPFSSLDTTDSPPKIETEWAIAFCRYDYSYYLPEHIKRKSNGRRVELSSSAPLSRPKFHLYEEYDRLVFREN